MLPVRTRQQQAAQPGLYACRMQVGCPLPLAAVSGTVRGGLQSLITITGTEVSGPSQEGGKVSRHVAQIHTGDGTRARSLTHGLDPAAIGALRANDRGVPQ